MVQKANFFSSINFSSEQSEDKILLCTNWSKLSFSFEFMRKYRIKSIITNTILTFASFKSVITFNLLIYMHDILHRMINCTSHSLGITWIYFSMSIMMINFTLIFSNSIVQCIKIHLNSLSFMCIWSIKIVQSLWFIDRWAKLQWIYAIATDK